MRIPTFSAHESLVPAIVNNSMSGLNSSSIPYPMKAEQLTEMKKTPRRYVLSYYRLINNGLNKDG